MKTMGTAVRSDNQPPRVRPLAEEIASALQNEIIAGQYLPGQRLVERELISRFSVSSIPVREALQQLEGRGLIVRRHNVGCSVIQLTPHETARICELRRTLEPQVMEWACERITDKAATELRRQLRKMKAAAAANDFPGYFQVDLEFHRMIWAAADNSYATRALEIVVGPLFAAGLIGAERAAAIDLRAEVEKHRRLATAIFDRDAKRAAQALLEIATGFEKHVPRKPV